MTCNCRHKQLQILFFNIAKLCDDANNFSTASKFYIMSGLKEAWFNLACMSRRLGLDGKIKDYSFMVSFALHQAARLKHPIALLMLGDFYLTGCFGIQTDVRIAANFYRIAARLNVPDAMTKYVLLHIEVIMYINRKNKY